VRRRRPTSATAALAAMISRRNSVWHKNMGIADRVIRVLLAIVVGILYLTGTITGTVAVILGIVAVVFLLTSTTGF